MAGNAFFALFAFWLVSVVFAQSNSTTTRSSTSLTSSSSRISTSTISLSTSLSSSSPSSPPGTPQGTSTFTAVVTNTSGASVVKSTTVLTVPFGNATSTGNPTTPTANNPVRTSSGPTPSSTPNLQNAAPARETAMLQVILALAATAMGSYYLLR